MGNETLLLVTFPSQGQLSRLYRSRSQRYQLTNRRALNTVNYLGKLHLNGRKSFNSGLCESPRSWRKLDDFLSNDLSVPQS